MYGMQIEKWWHVVAIWKVGTVSLVAYEFQLFK